MRRLIFLSILFCSLLLSCGKDGEANEIYFRGSFGDVQLSTSQSFAQADIDAEFEYIISGATLEDEGLIVTISFPITPSEGIYSVEEDNVVFIVLNGTDVWATNFSGLAGTVEIIEDADTYIVGTCSFEAEHAGDKANRFFTNGSFRARKL